MKKEVGQGLPPFPIAEAVHADSPVFDEVEQGVITEGDHVGEDQEIQADDDGHYIDP